MQLILPEITDFKDIYPKKYEETFFPTQDIATIISLKELQLQLFAIQFEIQSDSTKLCKI